MAVEVRPGRRGTIGGEEQARPLAMLAAALALITLVLAVVPEARPSAHSLRLQAAFETGAALVASLAGYLMAGRFARTASRHDLLLACSLGTLALSNIVFGVVPNIAVGHDTRFALWGSAVGPLLGAAILAYGAFAGAAAVRRPRRQATAVALACLGALGALALGIALLDDRLPLGVPSEVSPADAALASGSAANLAIQLATGGFFGLAAVGLVRRARRDGDELMAWFALGALLAAFARLHYFLFPSSQSAWTASSDVLRVAFYVVLLVGAAREIRAYQRNLGRLAAADERRRMARDLHDGLAQDLAFIATMGDQIQRIGANERQLGWLSEAASRAMVESRALIETLTVDDDDEHTLETQLRQVARQVAGRVGVEVEIDVPRDVEVPPGVRQAVVRIVGEALNNAARHSGCDRVRLEVVDEAGLRVRVCDDGRGFDAGAAARSGRYGLRSMDERARALGADLHVRSTPGKGTEVELVVR